MKSIIKTLAAILLMVSCTNNDKKDNNLAQKHETTIKIDSASVQDINTINKPSSAQVKKLVLAQMSLEDYIKLNSKDLINENFAPEQIKSGISFYQEGTVKSNHTLVTNPASTHQIKYLWDNNNQLAFVEASYKKYDKVFNEIGIQMVESENGLYLGMKLEDLVKWNNSEIEFYGFGWDYGGGIKRKEGDKLSKSDYIISLGADYNQISNKLMGDTLLNSSSKIVKESNIYISKLTYYLDK